MREFFSHQQHGGGFLHRTYTGCICSSNIQQVIPGCSNLPLCGVVFCVCFRCSISAKRMRKFGVYVVTRPFLNSAPPPPGPCIPCLFDGRSPGRATSTTTHTNFQRCSRKKSSARQPAPTTPCTPRSTARRWVKLNYNESSASLLGVYATRSVFEVVHRLIKDALITSRLTIFPVDVLLRAMYLPPAAAFLFASWRHVCT